MFKIRGLFSSVCPRYNVRLLLPFNIENYIQRYYHFLWLSISNNQIICWVCHEISYPKKQDNNPEQNPN
ncbi:hypothetical protein DERP_002972 [Dermatophagoides pteronyssinus]|uniref:Uncharacterized protein n=1 Tax=Dermatophagoides pteronyssinus TaxID=6956 RepID=A0ABQ8JW88_DERPT|nr:hypothetical protein DERP_002972 [Dermatophagoides pteronyssinus]